MTTTEKLLRELIALPSVNPAFLPAGHPATGEERVARFLQERAGRAGLETELQWVAPGRPNLVVRLGARQRRGGRRVLLAPHLDTVGGDDLPGHYFTPLKKQGRLYGRGACDTKGCVAAMFLALLDVAQGQQRPAQTEVMFVGLMDEENTQTGARAFARQPGPVDLAVVGEPTQLRVVTAHKGDLWLRLETRGKAAHGARPELGRNAVHEMARVVEALLTEYAGGLSKRRHSILGPPTISVGQIAGGRQPNIVPDHCWISVDRRTVPGEKDTVVKRELLEFLRQRGLRVRMRDTKGVPSRPLETDPGLPVVQSLMSLTGQREPAGVDFFSDAGVFGAAGIPSVLLGPGDIAQAHTVQEWIRLEQLEQARRLLRRWLEGLP